VILKVKQVLAEGVLGEIEAEFHFDRYIRS
jgi:hypothetical protein